MNAQKRFLVRKSVVFGTTEYGENLPELTRTIPGCNGVEHYYPVATFASKANAMAHAQQLNQTFMANCNPIWLRNIDEYFNDEVPDETAEMRQAKDHLAEMGYPIPELETVTTEHGVYYRPNSISDWYDHHAAEWTPDIRDLVWRALAIQVDLYDVIEIDYIDE